MGQNKRRKSAVGTGELRRVQGSYPQPILIHIAVQPVMDHDVPGAVVVGEGSRVPPVLWGVWIWEGMDGRSQALGCRSLSPAPSPTCILGQEPAPSAPPPSPGPSLLPTHSGEEDHVAPSTQKQLALPLRGEGLAPSPHPEAHIAHSPARWHPPVQPPSFLRAQAQPPSHSSQLAPGPGRTR